MTRVSRVVLLVAGMLAGYAGAAYAQAMGPIFGKVTDHPAGTAGRDGHRHRHRAAAAARRDDQRNGTYQFPSVPIGTYTVTFELASFKKAVRSNIIITTGSTPASIRSSRSARCPRK